MRANALILAILCGLPVLLLATSTNVPIHYTGAPTDGGLTCTKCHAATSGTGSVSVSIPSYTPNLQQILHVTITDPTATNWGFQMTARSVSDENQEAGTFTPSDPTITTVRCDDGSTLGSPGPCTGQREFAQHVTAPLTPHAPGSYTFDVLWTPPSQDIGKVVFYVAAVAGNNDGTAGGDRTYTAKITVPVIAACNNTQKPVINQILNSGSLTTTLASGGLWTIKGLNFESSNLKRSAGLGDFTDAGFPTTLGCIAVTVNGVRQPILYVQTDQINFQGPVGSGAVQIAVISNPDKPGQLISDAANNVPVQPVAPAFLTFNGTSIAARFSGTANIVANPAVVASGKPAKAGDIVELYAIGFGATDPSVAPGAITQTAAKVTTAVTVTIGGIAVNPPDGLQYVGLTPTAISGLYQLNVRIPAGTPNGDIPVVVTAGGVQTQFATIPIQN